MSSEKIRAQKNASQDARQQMGFIMDDIVAKQETLADAKAIIAHNEDLQAKAKQLEQELEAAKSELALREKQHKVLEEASLWGSTSSRDPNKAKSAAACGVAAMLLASLKEFPESRITQLEACTALQVISLFYGLSACD